MKDVIIIGAGPAGSVAAALLQNKGHNVLILERETFPRFSIGESLLPQCMEFIEQAGMLKAVKGADFQLKKGATFIHRDRQSNFSFDDKFTSGFDSTFQVQRDRFDSILSEQALDSGAEIRWQQTVTEADFSQDFPNLAVCDENGKTYRISTKFVLDASGFGRVLPRLLELELPSGFPERQSLFTHIEDCISCPNYNRDYIRIMVHPHMKDVWYWLIPFSDGRSSIGIVAESQVFEAAKEDDQQFFQNMVMEEPSLKGLLENSKFDRPVRSIQGYSASVKNLYGKGYALLGNAGEFIDPVFSSGVTIAMKSASLAADVLDRQLRNESYDWENEFAVPLMKGVETFKTFVTSWYEGGLQDVIFYGPQQANIKAMICAILAGYVWDQQNPYVKNSRLRLKTLVELCRETH